LFDVLVDRLVFMAGLDIVRVHLGRRGILGCGVVGFEHGGVAFDTDAWLGQLAIGAHIF
jgi:hypothetical protein